MSSTVGISDSTAKTATETLTNKGLMGKEDFLNMLTMQLRYQDPLNPMKNEQFAAQLAQFSSLETLQNINSNIQSQILLNQSMNNSYMITLIGKDVKSYGNTFSYEKGKEASIYFDVPRDADDLKVKVLNDNGKVIATIDPNRTVKAGERAVVWDGKLSDGSYASTGNYTFEVEASDSIGQITVTPLSNGLVTGIGYDQGTPYLIINGEYVAMGDIISVNAHKTDDSSTGSGNSSTNGNSTQSSTGSSGENKPVNPELSRFISRVMGIN